MRELEAATLVPIIQEHYLNFSLDKVKEVHRIDNSISLGRPIAKLVDDDIPIAEVRFSDMITYGRYVFSYNEEFQILVIGYADELE